MCLKRSGVGQGGGLARGCRRGTGRGPDGRLQEEPGNRREELETPGPL